MWYVSEWVVLVCLHVSTCDKWNAAWVEKKRKRRTEQEFSSLTCNKKWRHKSYVHTYTCILANVAFSLLHVFLCTCKMKHMKDSVFKFMLSCDVFAFIYFSVRLGLYVCLGLDNAWHVFWGFFFCSFMWMGVFYLKKLGGTVYVWMKTKATATQEAGSSPCCFSVSSHWSKGYG